MKAKVKEAFQDASAFLEAVKKAKQCVCEYDGYYIIEYEKEVPFIFANEKAEKAYESLDCTMIYSELPKENLIAVTFHVEWKNPVIKGCLVAQVVFVDGETERFAFHL